MSNHIEYNDTAIFHPGYYIEKIVKGSGLSKEIFAMRLNISSGVKFYN